MNISPARWKKYLKDNQHNSFHLAPKSVRIFVLGYCLFVSINNFPRASFWETVLYLRTHKRPRTNIPACLRAKWKLLFVYINFSLIYHVRSTSLSFWFTCSLPDSFKFRLEVVVKKAVKRTRRNWGYFIIRRLEGF